MSIDRADFHIDEARTLKRACRHIALFLWWAAERGLAAPTHEVASLRRGPTRHFLRICDGKLWDADLTPAGVRFANKAYEAYLREVDAYARAKQVDAYALPETAPTAKHFFAWLDAKWAGASAARPKAARTPPARAPRTTKRSGKRTPKQRR